MKKLMFALLSLGGIILLLAYPKEFREGISDGLNLCGGVLIPSLFPFMAVAGMIMRLGAAEVLARPFGWLMTIFFRLPKSTCGGFLLSIIGGYPVGAATVASLYERGQIHRKEAERMLTFCTNAGPAMVVVAIGKGMLGSFAVGWVIYLSHIAAAIATGWFFSRFGEPVATNKRPQIIKSEGAADAFVGGVTDASLQMVTVCGFVALFCSITQVFKSIGAEPLCALAEVTCGTRWAAQNGLSAAIICAILGFGGFSVMCQILSLSRGLISFWRLLLARTVNGAIGWVVCTAAIKLLPQSLMTMSNTEMQLNWALPHSIALSVSMLIMAAVFLTSVGQMQKR